MATMKLWSAIVRDPKNRAQRIFLIAAPSLDEASFKFEDESELNGETFMPKGCTTNFAEIEINTEAVDLVELDF